MLFKNGLMNQIKTFLIISSFLTPSFPAHASLSRRYDCGAAYYGYLILIVTSLLALALLTTIVLSFIKKKWAIPHQKTILTILWILPFAIALIGFLSLDLFC